MLVYSDDGVQYYCHFYLFIISLRVHDHAMELSVKSQLDCLLAIHLLPASKSSGMHLNIVHSELKDVLGGSYNPFEMKRFHYHSLRAWLNTVYNNNVPNDALRRMLPVQLYLIPGGIRFEAVSDFVASTSCCTL